MRSLNIILAAIAALIVSVSASPPRIGRGTFKYDPNSISQNENILRLFLRLASHTASHLIYLKNETKHQEESKGLVDANVPKFRIDLAESVPEERIAGRGHYRQSGRPSYHYRQDPRTTKHRELSRDRYNSVNDLSAERVYGPYIPATEDSLSSQPSYGKNRGRHNLGRRENDDQATENPENDVATEDPVEVEKRFLFLTNIEKKDYTNHYYNDQWQNTNNADIRLTNTAYQKGISNGMSTGPVILNQSGGYPGYYHRSLEESSANRANIDSNNAKSSSSGHAVIVRNAGSMLSSNDAGVMATQSATGALKLQSLSHSGAGILSAGTEVAQQTMTAASNLQSASESGAENQSLGAETAHKTSNALTSNLQSASNAATSAVQSLSESQSSTAGAAMTHQAMTAASNLQSVSNGLMNSVGNTASDVQSAGQRSISDGAVNSAASLHTASTGMVNSVQGVATDSQNAGQAAISDQAMTAASNLQSATSGLINSVHNHSTEGKEIAGAAIAASSNMQSSSLNQLHAVKAQGSQMLAKSMNSVNGDEASKIMNSLADSQQHQSAANNAVHISDSSKSEESAHSNSKLANLLTNHGSSLANASKGISAIKSLGIETSGAMARLAKNSDAKVVEGISHSATSLAGHSTGKTGQLLGGLTNTGTKITGTLAFERGPGTGKAASIQTTYERTNSASGPLFRSFPDFEDQSKGSENTRTADTEEGVKEVLPDETVYAAMEEPQNSSLYDAVINEDGEAGVSEDELKEYANQFADALRPVGTN